MQNDIVRQPTPKSAPPEENNTDFVETPQAKPDDALGQTPEPKPLVDPRTVGLKADITPPPQPQKEPEQESETTEQPEKPKKKSSFSKIAVSFAIIIFLSLAGVAVYLGMNKDKSTPGDVSQTTSDTVNNQPQPQVANNTQQNLKQIISDVDGLPADEDTTESDLSDKTLGL